MKVLIDTDILSLYFKQDVSVSRRVELYLAQHQQLSFSIITRFEILRGLNVRGASKQLRAFDSFCEMNEVIGLNDEIVVRAAGIYADLFKNGKPIGDADILIAATALERRFALVTNNERHFERINGIVVQNWSR